MDWSAEIVNRQILTTTDNVFHILLRYVSLLIARQFWHPHPTPSHWVQFACNSASEEVVTNNDLASEEVITINDSGAKAFHAYIAVYIQKPGREASAPKSLTCAAKIQSITRDGLDGALWWQILLGERQEAQILKSNAPPPPTHLVCHVHLIANLLGFHMSLVVVVNCGAGNALRGFEISIFIFFWNFILYTYSKTYCCCGHKML